MDSMQDIREKLTTLLVTTQYIKEGVDKTNGRVNNLERQHADISSKVAVLSSSVERLDEDIKKVDEDLSPKVEKSQNIMAIIKGNWQAVFIVAVSIAYLFEKLIDLGYIKK